MEEANVQLSQPSKGVSALLSMYIDQSPDPELKLIPGHPGYAITSSGRVYSYKTSRWLKQYIIEGYRNVHLYTPGKPKTHRVHILVLETFVGPRPRGMWGLHINDKRYDCRLENLEWGTPSTNYRQSQQNRRRPESRPWYWEHYSKRKLFKKKARYTQ